MLQILKYKTSRVPPVLKHVLEKRGWQKTLVDGEHYDLHWKNGRFSHKEMSESPNAKHNHFSNTHWITRKGHLQNLLKLSYLHFGKCYDFFPRSWVFTTQSKELILDYERKRQASLPPSEQSLWIGKPSDSSRGRGILLTKDLDSFLDESKPALRKSLEVAVQLAKGDALAQAELEADAAEEKPDPLIVVQEYIRNPMLVGGYKFDLRLYVLVTSFHPLQAYLFNDGLARFCTKPYCEEDLDPLRHLTNSSIHSKVLSYGLITPEEERLFSDTIDAALGPGDFSKRNLRSLLAHFYQTGVDYQTIWKRIIDVINLTLLSLLPDLGQSKGNCFELLGFDILLTADGQPKLVEVNMGPSLAVSGPVDQIVKQPLMEDMLDVLFPQGQPENPARVPLMDIVQPSSPVRVGDFSQIFPFSETSAQLAQEISLGLNSTQRVSQIIEEINNNQKKE